ncbi:hypothetical protein VHEMI01508 [[Torrubiella] hemipterigena]|nr:hypothetical protein VHEMI01508 [[Torrubiella] hemipterigena]
MKRVKKALPPGISENDGQVLTKVKRRAYRMDMALFDFAGIRFGWGSVIGIVPFIGDAMDTLMAIMVLRTCEQIDGGLPTSLKMSMIFNIMVDFVIGLVPFLGDLCDAVFKANTRNALLLEQHLREKGQKGLKRKGEPLPDIDPSSPEEYDRARSEVDEVYARKHASKKARTSTFGRNKTRPDDLETGVVDTSRPATTRK